MKLVRFSEEALKWWKKQHQTHLIYTTLTNIENKTTTYSWGYLINKFLPGVSVHQKYLNKSQIIFIYTKVLEYEASQVE